MKCVYDARISIEIFWDELMFSFSWLYCRRIYVSLAHSLTHSIYPIVFFISLELKNARSLFRLIFFSVHCFAWLGLASSFFYFPTVSGTHRAAQIKITKTKWNQRFSNHTILLYFCFTMHACAFVSLSFAR